MALQRNPLMCQNPTIVVGSLKIDCMYGHAAPDAVLELISCQFKAKENAYKNSVPVWTMATNAKHQSTILNALI